MSALAPRTGSSPPGASGRSVTGGRLVAGALAVAAVLVVVYLALGGGGYEPSSVADPCSPREWRSPEGIEEATEQFTLSALDGAACELGVSRETLALGLATPEAREEFAARYEIDDAELEAAVRAGLVRAIDDAERAGALSAPVAAAARALAERVPVDEAIGLIEDARGLLEGGEGALGSLGGLLDSAGEALP